MKILIPTLEYPPQIGGIANYIHNQILHWPNKLDCFSICTPKETGDSEFDKKNKWKTYRINPFFKYFWPHWFKLYWQVWKIVKKDKIEMIHVHHVLPIGYIAYINKKLHKLPYYIFFHGRDLGLAFINESKFKKTAKICQQADKIIVNSNFIKKRLLEYLPEIENKIKVVYPCPSFVGDDLNDIKLAEIKNKINPNNNKIILSVSRFVKRKGLDKTIKTFKDVLIEFPKAVYYIIGTGPDKERLEKIIINENLGDSIKILSVSREDLPYYYKLSDVFVLTPRELDGGDVEAFGMVYLEASLFGLPIVASNSGGVPEAVLNDKTGVVIDPNDEKQISKEIINILKNKELATKLGKQGRGRILKDFIWEKQFKKIAYV